MVFLPFRHHRKPTDLRQCLIALCSIVIGYVIGSSFESIQTNKGQMAKFHFSPFGHYQYSSEFASSSQHAKSHNRAKLYVTTNPPGAERLPPGILEPYSDLHLHDFLGNSTKDSVAKLKPKHLLALTVGYDQKDIIDSVVTKFSDDFSIVLFHYDGRASEWDQFKWSEKAIHISTRKQTKWWYAKRFLHPDIVAAYEYVFIWDEDLGVQNFNPEEYIRLVKKHGLEISQPAIESKAHTPWLITKRRHDVEAHKEAKEKDSRCGDPHLPPCAGFVEIMAPVFSRKSWRCVWHMIQNDLVHGWGLDLNFWKCVENPHEDMGVVDAQWIEHKKLPSLGDQGESTNGRPPWEGVRGRCYGEWREFERRLKKAARESKYLIPRWRW